MKIIKIRRDEDEPHTVYTELCRKTVTILQLLLMLYSYETLHKGALSKPVPVLY